MSEERLDEIKLLLEEHLRWTRAAVSGQIRETLERVLATTPNRRAYEAMDGTRVYAEISKEAEIGTGTVSNWARAWRALGLVYENDDGRTEHVCSLGDLGISVDATD